MTDEDNSDQPKSPLPDTGGRALEMFKEAAKDINDGSAGSENSFLKAVHIPALATILSFMSWGFSKWEAWQFQKFLERIAIPVAFGNIGAAVSLISENLHERYMSEGLARGWRLGLDTMDDTARVAAYAMVADYMVQKKKPDRLYRQLGELFKDSDIEILATVLHISDALEELDTDWVVFVLVAKEKPTPRNSPIRETQRHIHVMRHSGHFYDGMALDWSDFYEALEVLMRISLVDPWGDELWDHPKPTVFEIVENSAALDSRQMDRWKQIRIYLDPLRVVLFNAEAARKAKLRESGER